ncbi:MAG: SIS domain-containing protein [Actinomycetota bacterium]|nr:SIS domain-containing protein [Actinomycetota bacterium]
MAREIAEQPAAVHRTLESLIPLRHDVRTLATGRSQVLFAARGTSDNAAVYGRYLLETHSRVSAALAAPSIATHYRAERDLSNTVVVSLSQSGQTAEIVETQAWARRCGAATVAVTNDATSALAASADLPMITQAGQEFAVPATKSYTAQLAALAVLATALAPEPESLDSELHGVPDEIEWLLGQRDSIDDVVSALAGADSILATGRGLVLGTAQEVALKIEETCLRPVRGLSYADLKHGPIAIVREGLIAVLVASADGPMVPAMVELAADLTARGATVIGFGGDEDFRSTCHLAVPGPRLTEVVAPLGLIVGPQLAVEMLARHLGLDPDAPRGLSKVTQTDQPTHPPRPPGQPNPRKPHPPGGMS